MNTSHRLMTTEAEFNRLSIALRDFEQAIAFAEEAQKSSPSGLSYEALIFATIVCYYRPFSPNEKGKNASATSQLKIEDFSPLSSLEAALHKKCKELRNEALAHSEYKRNPTRLDTTLGVISSRPFSLLSHAPNLADLESLARKLAEQCHHKRADYTRQQSP